MTLRILLCIVLLIMAIQDFRFRAIHWVLFPVLLLLFIAERIILSNPLNYIPGTAINLLLIFIQGLVLYCFYKLQGKTAGYILSRIIGPGDVLFILIMAFAFGWTSFMFYYITGLLFALLAWLVIRHIASEREKLIPLAGLLAVYMMIIVVIDIVAPDYGRTGDMFGKMLVYVS